MGWVVNATPRPLYPWEIDPAPIVQEAGWAPWPVWMNAENLAPTGIRFPDRPARSESLYLLSHPSLIIPIDKTLAKCYRGRMWESNIQVSPQGAGCESVKWGKVERDRIQWWAVGNKVLKLRDPRMAWDFLIECFGFVNDCWGRIIHMELVLYLISHKILYLLS